MVLTLSTKQIVGAAIVLIMGLVAYGFAVRNLGGPKAVNAAGSETSTSSQNVCPVPEVNSGTPSTNTTTPTSTSTNNTSNTTNTTTEKTKVVTKTNVLSNILNENEILNDNEVNVLNDVVTVGDVSVDVQDVLNPVTTVTTSVGELVEF